MLNYMMLKILILKMEIITESRIWGLINIFMVKVLG